MSVSGSDWVGRNFAQFEKSLNGSAVAPIHTKRKEALSRFLENGFPTPKTEDWKYTNLAPIASGNWAVPTQKQELLAESRLNERLIPNLPGKKIVFRNGRLSPELSDLADLPKGIHLVPLSQTLGASDQSKTVPVLVKDYVANCFGKQTEKLPLSLVALNTSFILEGAALVIEKGVSALEPIQLVFVSEPEQTPVLITPRIFVVCEEHSEISLVEHYLSFGQAANFTSPVTEIFVKAGAVVDHIRIQEEDEQGYHIATIFAELFDDSVFSSHSFSFGGGLVRNEIRPVLQGERIKAVLNGLTVLNGNQHVDNSTVIDHAKPNCESHELYKGVYAEKSAGVFSGTIIVQPDAQKTNAIQTNQSLLLSDSATIDSRPQLKIWADDVKCTHGATVGQLDDDALFYLRSRGISKDIARNLLIHAFASDVIACVKQEPMRDYLEKKLIAKLGEEEQE